MPWRSPCCPMSLWGKFSQCSIVRVVATSFLLREITALPVIDHRCRRAGAPQFAHGSEILWLYESAECRLHDGFGAGSHTEFRARVIEMKIDRPFGQAEEVRDLRRRLAAGGPGQYFRLATVE